MDLCFRPSESLRRVRGLRFMGMSPRRSLGMAKFLLFLATIPVVVYGYETGPPAGVTGAPGDQTCIECHSSFPLNSQGGKVNILLPAGNTGTYVPGQTMQLLIQITDSKERAFGFEMTARLASAPESMQAGDFSPADANTQVLCADGNLESFYGSACPAQFAIEDIEHDDTGYLASINSNGSFTYTVNWTPPAAGSGNVTLYVSANCGPGQPAVQFPTHVYTSSLTLTPASNAPAITPNGVVPVFSSSTTIQPGSWISIYGSNLASGTTIWNGNFPTTLGGTSVTINGKLGYLWFVSSGQINLQAPDDPATGTVNVVVTNANGSATSTVTLGQAGPSFLLLDSTHVAGVILRSDGSGSQGGGAYDFLGPTGTSLGFPTVAAKAGDNVLLFADGFGPTSPVVTAGQAFSGAAPTTNGVMLTINGVSVTPGFAGLSGAGLYQINLAPLPPGLGTGDVALQGTVAGVSTPSGVVISLQ